MYIFYLFIILQVTGIFFIIEQHNNLEEICPRWGMKKLFCIFLSLLLFFGLFGMLLLDNLHQNRNTFADCYETITTFADISVENGVKNIIGQDFAKFPQDQVVAVKNGTLGSENYKFTPKIQTNALKHDVANLKPQTNAKNNHITKDIIRPELDEVYKNTQSTEHFVGNSFKVTPNNLENMYANASFSNPETNISHSSETKPQMAIVIDDFGYDRKGVEKMLNLDCTLTVAVMPALEFSEADAKTAHEKGHEVILHMPMEAYGNLPLSWYGPLFIANNDTPEVAYNKINQAINSIPYCNGVNIHMGTAVSQNKTLMREVLKATKERNLLFLDSRTIENTVCEEVGKELNAPVVLRDVFLEHGGANYGVTTDRITEAINLCLKNGKCIVIGHIGSVGRDVTAECLKANLNRIKSAGIEIVPLSAFK